jgi:hypothetical protein
MILINLIAFLLSIFLLFFLQVADEVEGGILYVESGVGEALHLMGALPFILRLGVRVVCNLENASPFRAIRTLSLSLRLSFYVNFWFRSGVWIVRMGWIVACWGPIGSGMEPKRAAEKWWCSPHTSSMMHTATFFDACVVTLMCGVMLCSHLFLRFQFVFAPCPQPLNSFRLCSHLIFTDNLSSLSMICLLFGEFPHPRSWLSPIVLFCCS